MLEAMRWYESISGIPAPTYPPNSSFGLQFRSPTSSTVVKVIVPLTEDTTLQELVHVAESATGCSSDNWWFNFIHVDGLQRHGTRERLSDLGIVPDSLIDLIWKNRRNNVNADDSTTSDSTDPKEGDGSASSSNEKERSQT